eukprot:1330270-Rhodomonas_salina.1
MPTVTTKKWHAMERTEARRTDNLPVCHVCFEGLDIDSLQVDSREKATFPSEQFVPPRAELKLAFCSRTTSHRSLQYSEYQRLPTIQDIGNVPRSAVQLRQSSTSEHIESMQKKRKVPS